MIDSPLCGMQMSLKPFYRPPDDPEKYLDELASFHVIMDVFFCRIDVNLLGLATLPFKDKGQYMLTCKVSRYRLLFLHVRAAEAAPVMFRKASRCSGDYNVCPAAL